MATPNLCVIHACGDPARYFIVPSISPLANVACEFNEPAFRFGLINPNLVAPNEPHSAGVKRLMPQNQSSALLLGLTAHREVQIKVFVAAVEFVADDRMADVREVDANLMLAAGARHEAQQCIGVLQTLEAALYPEFGLRRRAVGADAILDCHAAVFVPSEGRFDQALVNANMAMHDRQILLVHV